jgi:ribosomal protein S7
MNPSNRAKVAARIAEVAGHALFSRQVVTPIEVVAGIGWLPAAQVESWRRGRVVYLERVAVANLAKLNTALRLLADWARQRGLTRARPSTCPGPAIAVGYVSPRPATPT